MSQPTKQTPKGPGLKGNQVILLVVIAALVLGGAGLSLASGSSGAVKIACLSVSQHGSTVELTTSGLIHVKSASYYISCNEGTTLPTSPTTVSCLTITPQSTVSPYPGGQTTYVYYLNAPANSISIQGAAANSTEIIQPTNATISVNCG